MSDKRYDILDDKLMPDLESAREMFRDALIPDELEDALDEAYPDYIEDVEDE